MFRYIGGTQHTGILLLLLLCAESHMLSASRRQPHLLHVSAVNTGRQPKRWIDITEWTGLCISDVVKTQDHEHQRKFIFGLGHVYTAVHCASDCHPLSSDLP